MSKFNTGVKLMKNPKKMIKVLGDKKFFNWLPDRFYLKLLYWAEMGNKLNLDKPRSFNEKLQWIKLYDRKPEYSIYVDKYEVRKHITKEIGEEYLIPLIGVYESVDEIPWNKLPKQFVLKCTHGSGSNIVCRNKDKLDISDAKKKLNKWMRKNWYWFGREWPYKNVKPRIICEKYIIDESNIELKDYKFLCFEGEPKIIQVMSGRNDGSYYIDHFDLGWNVIDIPRKNLNENPHTICKPKNLDEMIKISKILSRGIHFVRIDFYETIEGVYFGEITFFPVSGFMDFSNPKDNLKLGRFIDI